MAEEMKSLFLLEDERKKSAVCFLGERGKKAKSEGQWNVSEQKFR